MTHITVTTRDGRAYADVPAGYFRADMYVDVGLVSQRYERDQTPEITVDIGTVCGDFAHDWNYSEARSRWEYWSNYEGTTSCLWARHEDKIIDTGAACRRLDDTAAVEKRVVEVLFFTRQWINIRKRSK